MGAGGSGWEWVGVGGSGREHKMVKPKKKIIVTRKKHYYKKRGSDIYRKSNYATFYQTSPRFLYFSTVHSDNGLYIVLSVEKSN